MSRKYVHPVPRLLRGLHLSNVSAIERWGSLALGLGIAALGLRRWKSPVATLALGGLLLRRGFTGECPIYRKLGLTSF